MLKKLIASLAVALFMTTMAATTTGCETTKGVGEDIENTGEAMDEAI